MRLECGPGVTSLLRKIRSVLIEATIFRMQSLDQAQVRFIGRLAQLVERHVYTVDVGGSSPSPPTIFRRCLCNETDFRGTWRRINCLSSQDRQRTEPAAWQPSFTVQRSDHPSRSCWSASEDMPAGNYRTLGRSSSVEATRSGAGGVRTVQRSPPLRLTEKERPTAYRLRSAA